MWFIEIKNVYQNMKTHLNNINDLSWSDKNDFFTAYTQNSI